MCIHEYKKVLYNILTNLFILSVVSSALGKPVGKVGNINA